MTAPSIDARWSTEDIIDAAHALDWDDHDIALLIATLEEDD